jgi:hypothetical protein
MIQDPAALVAVGEHALGENIDPGISPSEPEIGEKSDLVQEILAGSMIGVRVARPRSSLAHDPLHQGMIQHGRSFLLRRFTEEKLASAVADPWRFADEPFFEGPGRTVRHRSRHALALRSGNVGGTSGLSQHACEEGASAALQNGIELSVRRGELVESGQSSPHLCGQVWVVRKEAGDGFTQLEAERKGAFANRRSNQDSLDRSEKAARTAIDQL